MSLSRFVQSPLNVKLTGMLPVGLARCCTQLLGWIYFLRNPKIARDVMVGFSRSAGKEWPGRISMRVYARIFLGILEHYFEKLLMAYNPIEKTQDMLRAKCDVPDESWLRTLGPGQRGGMMLTGHFGAVEFLPLALALRGYRNAVILRYATPHLKKAHEHLERAVYPAIRLIDADEGLLRHRAIEALAEGRILITACDEFKKWRPQPGHFVTVFGRQVLRDNSLDAFYDRVGAPVSLGVMLRENGRYSLEITPLADGKEAVSLSCRAWGELEKYIQRYPEQWYQWAKVRDLLSLKKDHAHANRQDLDLPAGDSVQPGGHPQPS